jgi:membrane-associated two-gene conflict system component 1 (EACC1)
MGTSLKLSGDQLGDAELQRMTDEMADVLGREAGITAEVPRRQPGPGEKGEPITIGLLVMAAITSGAIPAFFDVVGSFVQRSRRLEISVTGNDGRTVTLTSENVSQKDREHTIAQLRDLMVE